MGVSGGNGLGGSEHVLEPRPSEEVQGTEGVRECLHRVWGCVLTGASRSPNRAKRVSMWAGELPKRGIRALAGGGGGRWEIGYIQEN